MVRVVYRRRKIYPEYKQNRKTKYRVNRSYDFASQEDEKQNMIMQLQRVVEYLDNLPVTVLSYDNIEADDTIGYICRQVLTESQITVMSTDKDFLQLANGRIKYGVQLKRKYMMNKLYLMNLVFHLTTIFGTEY